MEGVLREDRREELRRQARRQPPGNRFHIQELYRYVTQEDPDYDELPQEEYREVPGEEPLRRLLRLVKVYVQRQEFRWTRPESLASFIGQFRWTIGELTQNDKDTFYQIIWGSRAPCCNQRDLAREIQRLNDRLALATKALMADDPQLAVSLIRNEMTEQCLVDLHSTARTPIDHRFWIPRGPDRFMVLMLDSAYASYRLAIDPLDVESYVDRVAARYRARPDRRLHDFPTGVLRGQCNHHAREDEMSFVENCLLTCVRNMQDKNVSLLDQRMHLQDTERSWAAFVESPSTFQSIRTPPPIEPNAPSTFRRLDPREALKIVREQITLVENRMSAQ